MEAPFKNSAEAITQNLEELKKIKTSGLPKGVENSLLRKKLAELSNGKWDIHQDILLDIEVAGQVNILLEKQKIPYSCPDMLLIAKSEIEKRFASEPELITIITESLPGVKTLQRWIKRQDWREEVERRMKDDNLFSLDKRSKVISMIYNKAITTGDMKAAETYLKLSGDLSNQPQQKDKGQEVYQELVTSLIKNKS